MADKIDQTKKNTVKKAEGDPVKEGKAPEKKNTVPGFLRNEKFQRINGLFFLLLSIGMLVAFSSYLLSWKADDSILTGSQPDNWLGSGGRNIAKFFIKEAFGISSYIIVFLVFFIGFRLLFRRYLLKPARTFIISVILIFWFSITLYFIASFFTEELSTLLGGQYGGIMTKWLYAQIGKPGIILFLLFILMSMGVILFDFSYRFLSGRKKEKDETGENGKTGALKEDIYNTAEYSVKEEEEEEDFTFTLKRKIEDSFEEEKEEEKKNESPPLTPNQVVQSEEVEFTIENDPTEPEPETENLPAVVEQEHYTIDTPYDPTLDLRDYHLPPLDLLEEYGSDAVRVLKEELEGNKNKIVDTLNNYAIEIQKIKATIGPTVTLYEIVPSPGIRISRIKNLEDDIALSLSALGIRIIAPIPGKGTIGIEVPNQNPEIVSLKSIISSEKFVSSKYELPIGIGKTISNESYVADLAKMPHLLMAGATGQGKSVGLNAIITSLVYKKHPAELKFVLVDPKKVELTLFSKIERHYLAKLPDSEEAIITDTRKVVRTLMSLSIEMDNRYELLKDAQVRNIKEYNAKFIARKLNPIEGHRFLPYIVLIVDEFADLIMTAGKEIEAPITRLAQLARAVGIHLVIATQRPSVNIITGSIKANFPARVAFRVISKIDSRTILDSGGAEQLIGRGDMLLSTGSDLIRLQCAFIDIQEIDRVTEFIGSQRGYPDAFHLPEYYDEEHDKTEEFDPAEKDELFEDAARLIVQTQQGSTSLLQRKLKLGYNRAGRIIDQLEAAGIVGPFEGSKAREVKIHDIISLEQFLRDFGRNSNY